MLGSDLANGYDFIVGHGSAELIALFWYVVLFEVPRYGLSFLAIAVLPLGGAFPHGFLSAKRATARFDRSGQLISVVVVGHSEAHSLERCVRSLWAQSLAEFEIVVVSDGSRDKMTQVARRLVRMGLVDRALATDLRCGKAAGMNLAIGAAKGDIIINVDCDCSYDRFALESILAPFSEPEVGAVSGDILPRNGNRSLLAAFQTIEYLVGISLGKRAAGMLNQVVCVSGAFGAFRRSALDSVGGMDPGGGEDLDLTMRLRARGWKIRFEPGALCYTDVPATSWALVRQRLRWERDSIRVRFRKHKRLMWLFSPHFRLSEAYHQIDFLIFHVGFGFLFPLYLAFLSVQFGSSAFVVLFGVQLIALLLDVGVFALALIVTGRWHYLRYIVFLPGYGLYTGLFMRAVRLWAYAEEWSFDASRRDSYVPSRVSYARHW